MGGAANLHLSCDVPPSTATWLALESKMSDRMPGRLSKWQLALLIGVPLGLAAAVATGGAIYVLAKRRKRGSAGVDPASGEQPVSTGTKPPTAGSEAGTASAGRRVGAGKEEASKNSSQVNTC